MAESSLSVGYKELCAEVGAFMGWGRGEWFGEKAWTDKVARDIESFVKAGYANFLKPPRLDGERVSYNWSFLHPTASLTLSSGESTVALPDDFGGLEGWVTIADTAGAWNPIQQVNEGVILAREAATSSSSGAPQMVAVVPIRGTSLTKGQRLQLHVYPTADQAYTLSCQYYVLDHALSLTRPWPLGGAAHGQTILASCLAVAEQRRDNERGVQYQHWMDQLAASIGFDRRLKPQHLGRNTDRSDLRWGGNRTRHDMTQTVASYNGSFYGGE